MRLLKVAPMPHTFPMRKLLGAVALVLALAGCGAPTSAPKVDADAVFLQSWDARFPSANNTSAIAVAKSICDAYDSGTTFASEVNYLMATSSATAGDAGFMIGAATSSYCPKYNNRH